MRLQRFPTFILATLLLWLLSAVPAAAATASLSVVFTQNGQPLVDPAQGRFYIYEEEKRERYLAWGRANRPARVEEGTYDVVIRYTNDTIVEERVLDSFELTGKMVRKANFSVSPAHLTIEITAGGTPIHVHTGSYEIHKSGQRGKPLASRRPGERVTLRTGRYDIEVMYRDPRGLQSTWLSDYLVVDEQFESVDIGVASAQLLVSMTHRGAPVPSAEGEWEVHRTGDPQPFTGALAGESVELPAGTYDIRVSYEGFGEMPLEHWVRDVKVEGSTHETIELVDEIATQIRVNVRRAGELLSDAWFSVYPVGDSASPLATGSSGELIDVPAGRYDIHCTYRKGSIRAETWLRDRAAEGLTELDADLPLRVASLTIRPPRRVRRPIERSSVLIMLDSSLEMSENMGNSSRMEVVQQTLLNTIDLLDHERVEVGLRVWGIAPSNQNSCKDSTLLMPLAPLNKNGIKQALELIRPSGLSPITDSLRKASGDLPADGRSTIVVLTGGTDSCSGDPCDAAARLIKRGRADRIHIVGLDQPKDAEAELDCIGTYHATHNRNHLRNSLRTIFREASNRDRGRVTVFSRGRNRWIASAELGQTIQLLEGRYDLLIRVGEKVFHWNDFEVRGEITKTAGRRR